MVCEATDNGHSGDTSADFAEAGEAATEGSGECKCLLGVDREQVLESQHYRLAAVVTLLMELAGTLFAGIDVFLIHFLCFLGLVWDEDEDLV